MRRMDFIVDRAFASSVDVTATTPIPVPGHHVAVHLEGRRPGYATPGCDCVPELVVAIVRRVVIDYVIKVVFVECERDDA